MTSMAGLGDFAEYRNGQLGYSIRYPASLLKPIANHSGAGQAFASRSGHAGFRVFGAALGNRSPRQVADEAQRICPGARPDYRVVKPTLVAVSCRTGDHIVYQKSLLRDGLELTVRGEYPADERSVWDPVITAIARSMSVAERADDARQ